MVIPLLQSRLQFIHDRRQSHRYRTTDPTENPSSELLTQLFDRVERLEAENERLQSELNEIRDRHREDCHVLARENHDLRDSQERLRERVVKAEEKDGFLLEDIIDLEDQLADLEDRSVSKNEGTDGDTRACVLNSLPSNALPDWEPRRWVST